MWSCVAKVARGHGEQVAKDRGVLLEMDNRLTKAGIMSLPMGRRDIADYLGSRAVSQLHEEDVLNFVGNTQRDIVILDRRRLASIDMPS